MSESRQHTVLIGGASKGLGLGCAEAFAESGYRIIMTARGAAGLEAAAEQLRFKYPGMDILTVSCDWSKHEDLNHLAETLEEKGIVVDILINNVGGPQPGKISDQTEESWKEALDLLFWSTIRIYGIVLPGMRIRKWGRIINILSTTVIEPSPALATSSVVRAALASYSKLVAWEVSKEGITVNSVMPAGFKTARTLEILNHTAKQKGSDVEILLDELEKSLPLGRFMEPLELGRAIVFLASDRAAGITGTLIPVDGGALRSL